MYKIANKQHWSGRVDNQLDESTYRLHQVVKIKDINELIKNESAYDLIGFECDEGVRRNKGRTGAASAPNEIRKFLSKLPNIIEHHNELIDVGNVACENGDLEGAQLELGRAITKMLKMDHVPIIMGGGHETLYGHYLGVRDFIGKESSLGIINIDAHFDMRNDKIPSSGTMFRQILEHDDKAGYLCLGIQELGNTQELFDRAKKMGCAYILADEIDTNHFQNTFQAIDQFSTQHDYIILTLCTDSIIAPEAPGVSAPSPFGLESKTARTLMRYIVSKENVVSFDLSEVNPMVDENDRTTRLAAYLIADVIKNFNGMKHEGG